MDGTTVAKAAFIYGEHHSFIKAVVLSKTRCHDDADELMQRVFIALVRAHTPTAPQAQPWLGVLDDVCSVNMSIAGATTPEQAMEKIWVDFDFSTNRVYDTKDRAPGYTTGPTFKLTSWLNAYPNIGTVNCHDMAQAEVIYANALGCGANYHVAFPSSGLMYVNCIRPLGCILWTNNFFYTQWKYDSNPIVNGDSAYDPPTSTRSYVLNHSFAVHNNKIWDASLPQADVDADPDALPVQSTDMGNLEWTTYKGILIDDVSACSVGAPASYPFYVVDE